MKRSADSTDIDDIVMGNDGQGELTSRTILSTITKCFDGGSMASLDERVEALALLGSVDFSLEQLDSLILTPALVNTLFSYMRIDNLKDAVSSRLILAVETSVALKNLMTSESVGVHCTRKLYALCLTPVITDLLQKLNELVVVGGVELSRELKALLESVAVMIWCFASLIPASIAQINNSQFVGMVMNYLSIGDDWRVLQALLQAMLVITEDNGDLARRILSDESAVKQLIAILPEQGIIDFPIMSTTVSLQILTWQYRFQVTLNILKSAKQPIPAAMRSGILASSASVLRYPLNYTEKQLEEEGESVKIHFEALEMASEVLDAWMMVDECGEDDDDQEDSSMLITKNGNLINPQVLIQSTDALMTFWDAHFTAKNSEDEETNTDRLKLASRLWTCTANLLSCLTHCITLQGTSIAQQFQWIISGVAGKAGLIHLSVIADEVSGYLRTLLMTTEEMSERKADTELSAIPSQCYEAFDQLFYCSSSPLVLINTLALLTRLIPYAPSPIQLSMTKFISTALLTDPFDADHLEILLSAVDCITAIFDPQSREWPAKSLQELKSDLVGIKGKLEACPVAKTPRLQREIKNRVRELQGLIRHL